MEIAATFNPVTYVMEAMRALILEEYAWGPLAGGFIIVALLGVLMVVLNVQIIRHYD
jgi:ABC-2 type transport system permease protein